MENNQNLNEQEIEITEDILKDLVAKFLRSGLADKKPVETELEPVGENSSDSLLNKNGENLKPVTIDESWGDRYERVVFMQGSEADEPLNILKNEGPEAALEFLKQWHYPGEHDGSKEVGNGSQDRTFEKDGYIMSWNPFIGYIGLVYDTQKAEAPASNEAPAEEPLDEDSLMRRHIAGQRKKLGNMPLGRHGKYSDSAK